MGWSIGADQIQYFQGVMIMIGGKAVFVNKIETADGIDFEISPGGELVLSGDNRLKLGKRIYLGDTGTSHSIYYDADGLHIESSLPIRMHPVLATGIEAPEAKFTTAQATNLIVSNLYHGGTWTQPGPGRWSMGADQYYEPTLAAYDQDGKLVQTNRAGATDGSWRLMDDGTGLIGGTVYVPQAAAEALYAGDIVYSSEPDGVSRAAADNVVSGAENAWGVCLEDTVFAADARIAIGGMVAAVAMASGLSPNVGDTLFLSDSEIGRATNASPTTTDHFVVRLGRILSLDGYVDTSTVKVFWNPQEPELI